MKALGIRRYKARMEMMDRLQPEPEGMTVRI